MFFLCPVMYQRHFYLCLLIRNMKDWAIATGIRILFIPPGLRLRPAKFLFPVQDTGANLVVKDLIRCGPICLKSCVPHVMEFTDVNISVQQWISAENLPC